MFVLLLPWRATEASSNNTVVIIPSAIDVSAGEKGAHALNVNEVDTSGESSTMVDSLLESTNGSPLPLFLSSEDISLTSLEADKTPK